LSLNLAGAPSQLLSRRNPMRQTERQGEEMRPAFKYCGKHEKHQPDPRVVEVVGKMLLNLEYIIEGAFEISTVVEHEDTEDEYRIALSSNSKVFVVIFYDPRKVTCLVRDLSLGGVPTSKRIPFEFNKDMRKAIFSSLGSLVKRGALRDLGILEELNK
jgi:hypothetical protein